MRRPVGWESANFGLGSTKCGPIPADAGPVPEFFRIWPDPVRCRRCRPSLPETDQIWPALGHHIRLIFDDIGQRWVKLEQCWSCFNQLRPNSANF